MPVVCGFPHTAPLVVAGKSLYLHLLVDDLVVNVVLSVVCLRVLLVLVTSTKVGCTDESQQKRAADNHGQTF